MQRITDTYCTGIIGPPFRVTCKTCQVRPPPSHLPLYCCAAPPSPQELSGEGLTFHPQVNQRSVVLTLQKQAREQQDGGEAQDNAGQWWWRLNQLLLCPASSSRPALISRDRTDTRALI